MNMESFKIGDRVEVSSKEVGFIGSYYEGTIVDVRNAYTVRYKELLKEDASGPLIETTDCSEIRPYPPTIEVKYFEVGDVVDAFDSDGWWIGVLVEIRGEVGYVRFDDYDGKVVGYPTRNIRIHLDWVDGEWSVKEPERIKHVEFHDWQTEDAC